MSTPISIHQRTYETEAFDEGDGTMRLVGRLVDTKPHGLFLADGEPIVIHDMTVEMIVHGDTFEILDVRPTMAVHPYGHCPSILESYRQLIGESIARGYSRKVKELFGGPGGCSHIGALLIALGPVAVQASWGRAQLHLGTVEVASQVTGFQRREVRSRRILHNQSLDLPPSRLSTTALLWLWVPPFESSYGKSK